MPSISLDGRHVTAPEGATILEAAELAGIEIPTLCHLPGRPPQTSCMLCVVRVEGMPRLVPSCATRVADGMVVANDSDEVRNARRTAIELLLSDHLGDCIGPCQGVCPACMDIPEMMRLTAEGRFREALIVVKERIPLPAVLGRICPELCEKGCRRAAHDGALSVCLTKRFVADFDLNSGEPYLPACSPPTGRRVAIVGSGPAGLSAAYYLRQMGHACTLFDEHPLPGGMLRYGVPRDELPEDVLDAEIEIIRRLGAEFVMDARVGSAVSLGELRTDYDAVLIAAGDVRSSAEAWPDVTFGPQGMKVDRVTMMTGIEGVFAAGGSLMPLRHAVRAVGDGRAAAHAVDAYLGGSGMPDHRRSGKEFSVHIGHLDSQGVQPFLQLGSVTGRQTPAQPSAGFTPEQAIAEAGRCLRCACAKASDCRLRSFAEQYGAQPIRFAGERRGFEIDDSHPDIVFEPGKCIACGICVRIAAEGREELGLGFVGRGFGVRTAVPFHSGMVEGLREVALACADACPTGALVRKNSGRG
ncbi:MAG: NAD(P)-binding protein [Chthonomonadales bacterium]|nr:NAD(P)-binding protein [Chthonomonadales bacterium]